MGTAKGSIQRRLSGSVIRKGLAEFLPTSVQKSYFMLSVAERDALNSALEKYRPGQQTFAVFCVKHGLLVGIELSAPPRFERDAHEIFIVYADSVRKILDRRISEKPHGK